MRRAELAKNMAAQQQQQKNIIQAHLDNSQFIQKLYTIPMFKAAASTAEGAYVKVKGSNSMIGKSLELATNLSVGLLGRLTPMAEMTITMASPLTTKVDAIAAQGLDGLIARVPVINEEPQEIVKNTRCAIETKVTVINSYTEAALKTWPVQSAMDVYEALLCTASNTLDNVLPPTKDEENKNQQNGQSKSTKESLGEEDKHKRGIVLARRTYDMFSCAFRRVFGKCQEQVQRNTEEVYKTVKNAVGDGSNTNEDSNVTNNGDVNNKQAATKKGKNKKNAQEQ